MSLDLIGARSASGASGGGDEPAAGESSGVVELVELDKSDENELMLPHVFEKLEDDDSEGPNGRGPGGNGLDLNLGFDGDEDRRVRVGVLGTVLMGDDGVEIHFVGDEGGLEGEEGSGWYPGWRETSSDAAEGVSSIR